MPQVKQIEQKLNNNPEFSQYLQEVWGRADGAGVDRDMYMLMMCCELVGYTSGCTTIIHRNNHNKCHATAVNTNQQTQSTQQTHQTPQTQSTPRTPLAQQTSLTSHTAQQEQPQPPSQPPQPQEHFSFVLSHNEDDNFDADNTCITKVYTSDSDWFVTSDFHTMPFGNGFRYVCVCVSACVCLWLYSDAL